MDYAPDSTDIAPEIAREMIAAKRIGAMEQLAKASSQCPDNLNAEEKQRLTGFIERRYQARLEQYERAEHVWDMTTSTVLAAGGTKE